MNDKSQIETLIEKYFEGLTSLKEEQILRDYFQGEEIAENLKIHKPLFQFFSLERETKNNKEIEIQPNNSKKVHFIRWISIGAAACLILFFSLKLPKQETSFAYVDGKKYTNIEQIQAEALKSLENISIGNEDIFSSQIEALEMLEF